MTGISCTSIGPHAEFVDPTEMAPPEPYPDTAKRLAVWISGNPQRAIALLDFLLTECGLVEVGADGVLGQMAGSQQEQAEMMAELERLERR